MRLRIIKKKLAKNAEKKYMRFVDKVGTGRMYISLHRVTLEEENVVRHIAA